MAVPDFQAWFLPFLKRLGDGKDHARSEVFDGLADDMGLSPEDRVQRLKSGAFIYRNRIAWAQVYLKKAGILEIPSRGVIRITQRGKDILLSPPPTLNVKFLKQFPEFAEFHAPKPDASSPVASQTNADEESPLETIERVHGDLNRELADDLLDRIKKSPPAFFEQLVVDLLLAMGYGDSPEDSGKVTGKGGDGGIDGVINQDSLGLEAVYIQAKRWDQAVGRPLVQAFAGSLDGAKARKGVMISTSTFTSDAKEFVRHIEKRIVLVDGSMLASLMIKHNVGVGIEAEYQVKKIDADYFPD
jgi:restriction system protein